MFLRYYNAIINQLFIFRFCIHTPHSDVWIQNANTAATKIVVALRVATICPSMCK